VTWATQTFNTQLLLNNQSHNIHWYITFK